MPWDLFIDAIIRTTIYSSIRAVSNMLSKVHSSTSLKWAQENFDAFGLICVWNRKNSNNK